MIVKKAVCEREWTWRHWWREGPFDEGLVSKHYMTETLWTTFKPQCLTFETKKYLWWIEHCSCPLNILVLLGLENPIITRCDTVENSTIISVLCDRCIRGDTEGVEWFLYFYLDLGEWILQLGLKSKSSSPKLHLTVILLCCKFTGTLENFKFSSWAQLLKLGIIIFSGQVSVSPFCPS